MKSFTYVITDKEGIHARPAGVVVAEAKKFARVGLWKRNEERVMITIGTNPIAKNTPFKSADFAFPSLDNLRLLIETMTAIKHKSANAPVRNPVDNICIVLFI